MEDDSSWKDIADGVTLGVHVSNVDDLGSNKARGATSHEEILLFLCIGGQAEVADGQVPWTLLSKHDVLRL